MKRLLTSDEKSMLCWWFDDYSIFKPTPIDRAGFEDCFFFDSFPCGPECCGQWLAFKDTMHEKGVELLTLIERHHPDFVADYKK